MVGKVKGERFQILSFTQTDFILSSVVHEINSIPILKSDKYVFLTPNQVVNPTLNVSVGDIEDDLMGKYFEKLQPYLKLIQKLRFDVFIKYCKDKRTLNHKLMRQGYDKPEIDDFVLIQDEKKHNYIRYGIVII